MIIQTTNFGSHRDVRFQMVNYLYNYGAHIHEFAELAIAIKGSLTVTVDGKKSLLSPGEAALIFPFQVHSFSSEETNELALFVFSPSMIPDFFRRTANLIGESAIFRPSEVALGAFEKKFRNATELSLYETTGFLYFIAADFSEQVKMIPKGRVNNITERVMNHINSRLAEKISLCSMAQELGYSPKYLSNCINKLFGMSISSLVSSLRIEMAKLMLRTTDKPGIEISDECGFGSERSFHRQFKAFTGMSPRAYRSKYLHRAIAQGFVTRFEPEAEK